MSDRGPQFISQLWKEFSKSIGAKFNLSSGYLPQSNGQTERCNQALETVLRCVSERNPSDCAKHLIWVEYAHNTLTSASTGISPFQASLGYNPPLFPELESEILVPFVKDHMDRCRKIWTETREALLTTAISCKQSADQHRRGAPTYTVGQQVWLSTRDIQLKNLLR